VILNLVVAKQYMTISFCHSGWSKEQTSNPAYGKPMLNFSLQGNDKNAGSHHLLLSHYQSYKSNLYRIKQ